MIERRQLLIGDYATAREGLFTLSKLRLETPKCRTDFQKIPGMDGELDCADPLNRGRALLENRKLEACFETSCGTLLQREIRMDEFIARCHGKVLPIILPDDPDHYLLGRISLSKDFNLPTYGQVTMTAVCEPYRYDSVSQKRSLPMRCFGDNIAHFDCIEKLPELSTVSDFSFIGSTEIVAPTLCTAPDLAHTCACFRLSLSASTEYYISGRIQGRGYWRVSSAPEFPSTFTPLIRSSAEGYLYVWIYRLSSTGICNLKDLLCLPAEKVSKLDTGHAGAELRCQLQEGFNGFISAAGRAYASAEDWGLIELPADAQVPIAAFCYAAQSDTAQAEICWNRRVI